MAGYLLAALGHLPGDGESAEVAGRRLTVTQLDGRRIARVRVSPAEASAAAARPGLPARPAARRPGRQVRASAADAAREPGGAGH